MVKQHDNDRRAQGVADGWVQVGAFGGAHGVKGELKLRAFTEHPSTIKSFEALHAGPDGEVLKLTIGKAIKGGFAARVEGINNREEAQSLNGTELFVPRGVLGEDLDSEDEFFLADLLGLAVQDTVGTDIGLIRTVENFGADDLLDIVLHEPIKGFGRAAMIPFTRQLVPTVDIKNGLVVVDLVAWGALQVEAPEETGAKKKGKA